VFSSSPASHGASPLRSSGPEDQDCGFRKVAMESCEFMFNAMSTSPSGVNESHTTSHDHYAAPPRAPLYLERLMGVSAESGATAQQEGFSSVASSLGWFGSARATSPPVQLLVETPVKPRTSISAAASSAHSAALFSTPMSKGCFNISQDDPNLWCESEATPETDLQSFWKVLRMSR
jgi:hypothetical protein